MSINTNSIYGIYGMEYQLRAANDDSPKGKKKKTNFVTLKIKQKRGE